MFEQNENNENANKDQRSNQHNLPDVWLSGTMHDKIGIEAPVTIICYSQ